MTIEEAKLFFTVPDEVDVMDHYEEQLFEYKQFFLAKSPIAKVFRAKLEKLKQMHQAYSIVAGLQTDVNDAAKEVDIYFSNNILEAFKMYEAEKGNFKLQLMQAMDANGIIHIVQRFLNITAAYRSKWSMEVEEDSTYEGVLSKDPDPMDLLREIRAFDQVGGKEFHDVVKIGSNSFLLNEMKRVSLLNKNYGG